MQKTYQTSKRWFLSLPTKKKWSLFILITLFIVFVGIRATKNSSPNPTLQTPDIRVVEISPVSNLTNNETSLAVSGTVTSRSEAHLRAEASGRITRVYKKLGDYVRAGEVIAEIENARETAALEQARALLDQTKLSQNISEITQGNAELLLNEARTNVINILRAIYDGVEDGIRNKIDPMFSNPTSASPEFNVRSNSQLSIDVNFARLKMQSILEAQRIRRGNLSIKSDILDEVKLTENELGEVKKFIDLVNATLNAGFATSVMPQTTIDGYKIIASTARTSWSEMVSSISTAKDNLSSKTAQFEISQKQGKQGFDTLTTSQTAIAQAESGLELAQVALERTVIRSPIFGTLNSLSITQGDSLSQQESVATVSNNGALEIVGYITSFDRHEIAVGNRVNIQNIAEGVVTRVAPALDPLTKKIEIRIGITKGQTSLLNGQSVNLLIARSEETTAVKKLSRAPISIPIISIKITSDGPVVFTFDATTRTLISHPVTIGALLGNRITITDGLTSSMEIVTDARGLKIGQTVELKK